MNRRPNLLLATGIVACALFAVKVVELGRGSVAVLAIVPAVAAQSEQTEAPETTPQASESSPPTSPDPYDDSFDPLNLRAAEIEILQKLTARREEIEAQADARERDLDLREQLLVATEQRIDAKIAELKEMKSSIENLIIQFDEEEEEKTRSLVKIYESMKP